MITHNTEVTTEKVTRIHYLNEVVVCDNNHTFKVNQALLIPFANDSKDLGNIMHLDSDYRLKVGCNPRQPELNGYLLACPICKLVHLSGFDTPPKEHQVMLGMDNTVAERKLELEL